MRTGGGHLRRCLVLARALGAEGWDTEFAVGEDAARVVPQLAAAGVACTAAEDAEGAAAALRKRRPEGVDLLVLDGYGFSRRHENAFRPWARRLLVVDDLADRTHDCDMLLDQTLGRAAEDYAGLVPADCRLLLGTAFAAIRPEFFWRRLRTTEAREDVRRVVVAFGATDPDNATAIALRGLAAAGLDAQVDVMLGAGAPHGAQVRRLADDLPVPCRVHMELSQPERLLAAADLAIGAAGVSAWERACLGLPGILVLTAANQQANAAALAREGAAEVVGDFASVDVAALARAIGKLAGDAALRRRMAAAAMRLCDGLGSRRVAAEIDPAEARDGAPVRLRPATADDGERLLAWQQDPETRRYARTPRPPQRKEHFAWLEGRLADRHCLMSIVLHGDEPAGVLRLDLAGSLTRASPAFEVSILVAPERQGRGVGKAALALARRLVPEAVLKAQVLPGNARSAALFEESGYQRRRAGWFVSAPRTPVEMSA